MNPALIRQQLSELLEAIQEQYEAIRNTEGQIPLIEFDILRENIRRFYEQLNLLQRPAPPESLPTPTPTPSPPVHTPVKPAERQKEAGDPREGPGKPPPPPPGPDLFTAGESAFSVRLKEAREASLPPKPKPVDHLKSLISINDKFSFINELFDGNLKEYNDVVDQLNRFGKKQEALGYLDQLRQQNLWDLGSGTFMKLKEIVEKYHL